MIRIACAALLLAACGDVGDPGDYPVPPVQAPRDERPAPPPPPTCEAGGGIWTVQIVLASPGPDVCGFSGRTSAQLDGSPVDAAMSVEKCDISRAESEDGCSVLCKKHSALGGAAELEMLISYESPSLFSGYAVLTNGNVRCEYDVTYTKN